MAKSQNARLERKKFYSDPILVGMIVVLLIFLLLFILYPLLMLLVDSFYTEGRVTLDVFKRVLSLQRFRKAFTNTLVLGVITGLASTLIGLLFAYVEVYVKVRTKVLKRLFSVVSMLPVVSPPFVLSLSMIMLFGRSGIITRSLLKIYDSNVYGLGGIAIVQTMTFFPVCYLMLKGLLKNIDPSLEEATRDMGASRWKVFVSVTLPLLLPGLGNAFLVTFIESVADFANPMLIGGSYDTLATTIYLQVTGAYDSTGAAAMSVVLLSLTLILFLIQKYYLERKTAATLTGKASRARMPIEDKSVTVPLTIICGLAAAFVILMYIMVPFGALFTLWGRDYSLSLKWFQYMFKTSGLKAFKDSFVLSLIAAPLTALLSMVISYLVVKRKFKTKGFIEFVSMLAMAVPGTVLGIGYIRGYANGLFRFTDVNAKVFGGNLKARGDYHIDSRVYHIYGKGTKLQSMRALNDLSFSCLVDLNLMLMCNGNPRNILAYGDFKSGKGHYSLLPFNSLEGRFTNRFRELHIYNAVIDTPFGRVSTDAFSIVNSKLHLGKIILTDQDTGKNVTIREEDKVKPQDQHYNPEEKRDKPKKAKGKPKARRASS